MVPKVTLIQNSKMDIVSIFKNDKFREGRGSFVPPPNVK
jgi:hypothetical protein